MQEAMDWGRLLANTRLAKHGERSSKDAKSEFQLDADKIVFSNAFRQLREKIQVFPFEGCENVRTRLTHTIEVATIGRTLGLLAREVIKRQEGQAPASAVAFSNILAAACLAHDIGNPPFGHYGEAAIREWFRAPGKSYLANLSAGEREDLLQFEGNAQGFRVLTRLLHRENPGGFQLTNATLAVFSKYPYGSAIQHLPATKSTNDKKFGVFCAEMSTFAKVAQAVGLIEKAPGAWCRHPLALLMEAADDICYGVVDLEDGCRIGCISFSEVERLLGPIASGGPRRSFKSHYQKLGDDFGKIEFLREQSIQQLVYAVRDAFNGNYRDIMAGRFENDLVSISRFSAEFNDIRTASMERIYNSPEVNQSNRKTDPSVLSDLLGIFVPAFFEGQSLTGLNRQGRLGFVPHQRPAGLTDYEKLLDATDAVSGLTDSLALSLSRSLRCSN